MKSFFALITALVAQLSICAQSSNVLPDGIYANFLTSKGSIICVLEYEKTPMTVANFVGLAEGNFKVDDKVISTPFYNGLISSCYQGFYDSRRLPSWKWIRRSRL